MEIEQHVPPSTDDLSRFLAGEHPGPNLFDLHLDLRGGLGSDWNKKAFHLLRKDFRDNHLTQLTDVPKRDDDYLHALITDQFERLAKIWKKAQPKAVDHGRAETPVEIETRMIRDRERALKENRHNQRRHTVSAPH
jgi:hypothetical protein